MSLSRWHMNKMGLVDFWCYENEVFEFEDGHMLLRGSNGSGKSVTMQSFIPLLLDGNKSSERLDPFGTRSRKMDTYLIDENTTRNERIGYLYLEFKREDSEVYKTIGMGLRARRGKNLEPWYFVIEDNRRVNHDFSLMENHMSLTEKQLKNILGHQVMNSQKEYMKRVNDALFGFENIEDYGDAITLLLQLRSPKLSNSLSPQKINEILASSLPPLSDDDLRPMSEAIVNMDNLQDQLENLRQSLEAANKLKDVYQIYNQSLLLEKWDKYDREHDRYQQLLLKYKQKAKYQEELIREKEDYQEKLMKHHIEYETKKNEYAMIKNSDAQTWAQTIHVLEQDIQEYQRELDKKTNTYEQKDNLYQDMQKRIDQYQQTIDQNEYECQKYLKEMELFNENLSLVEHIALKNCFDNKEKNFDFAYTRSILQDMMKQLNHGIETWQNYLQQQKTIDFYEQDESKKIDVIETLQSDIDKVEKSYQQMVESYLEEFYRYHEHNHILKLTDHDLLKMREYLIQYEATRDYSFVENIVKGKYQTISREKYEEQMRLSSKINEWDQKLHIYIQEKEDLESLDDIEPEKTQESFLNRQFLDNLSIPYIPLFKLLDFDETMTIEQRYRIEELFVKMNLLDALIIQDKYQDDVKKLSTGCQDYYLWTSCDVKDLDVFKISQLNDASDFFAILDQLFIQYDRNTVIYDNYFKTGVIEGSLALNHEAIYIGYESRIKNKEEQIKKYCQLIEEGQEQLNHYLQKHQQCQQDIDLLHHEYQEFISDQKLKELLEKRDLLKKDIQLEQERLLDIQKLIQSEYERLQDIYRQLQDLGAKLIIPVQYESFVNYQKDLQEYQLLFEKFKDAYQSMIQNMHYHDLQQENIVQIQNDLDELCYEKDQYQYKKDLALQKRNTLQQKLDEAGYHDIVLQLKQLQESMEQLEHEKEEYQKNIAVIETRIEVIDEELKDISDQQGQQSEVVELYWKIFEQEKDYHFVMDKEYSKGEYKKIFADIKEHLGHKKTIADYQNQLQRVYFEQNTYLNQYHIVQENMSLCCDVDDFPSRIILRAIHQGKKISFLDLINILVQNIEMQELLIADEDRHIFEEILVNTIGKKIKERIQMSRRWVEKIQNYMNDMNTSSGLQLNIKWKSKKASDESQLDSSELVKLLEMDYHILKDEDRLKISNHFRSKIMEARKLSMDENITASFHQLMKEVMDYRKWFDFTLFAKKPNENRKELTSYVFYAYSGGEKALSMYVPLFSAVAAKFESARSDSPLLIALDEAFAGVDENNINNMFALITKFGFDYIMNSQVLWGDYPACRSLAIYELFRPLNAPFVTVIAYIWNGSVKRLKY